MKKNLLSIKACILAKLETKYEADAARVDVQMHFP